MSDPRISQQPVAQPLSGSEAVPIVQKSSRTNTWRTVRTDINSVKDYLAKDLINALYPPGTVLPYASDVVDDSMGSWMLCDGRSLSLSAYPRLYKSIGTTYGSVNSNSFNIPNLKGRVVMGYCDTLASQTFNFGNWNGSNSVSVGTAGGEYTHKISKSEVPVSVAFIPTEKNNIITESGYTTVVQEISWRTQIDGSDYFDWYDNKLKIRHRGFQGPGRTSVTYKTYYASTNAVINEGTYSTPSTLGEFTLPFKVLQTKNVVIAERSGRWSISITEMPGFENNYKTTVLFDDDPPGSNASYYCKLKFTATYENTSALKPIDSGSTSFDTISPYMALNYIIKY